MTDVIESAPEAPEASIAPEVQAMIARMSAIIEGRAESAPNPGLARKWQSEGKALAVPQIAERLHQVGFDPARLEKMAIYAAQKVRRLAAALAGKGSVDPFTQAIIRNARACEGRLDSRLARGSLSMKVALAEGISLPARRIGTEGTASAQAGTTRQALEAVGAASVVRDGRNLVMALDLEHPMVAGVA